MRTLKGVGESFGRLLVARRTQGKRRGIAASSGVSVTSSYRG